MPIPIRSSDSNISKACCLVKVIEITEPRLILTEFRATDQTTRPGDHFRKFTEFSRTVVLKPTRRYAPREPKVGWPNAPSLSRQFPHPDVAEAERLALVPVGLQLDRGAVEFLVERLPDVAGLAF